MENASPFAEEDAFAGVSPAGSSSGLSFTEAESDQGAPVSGPAAEPLLIPHATSSPVAYVSLENASSKAGRAPSISFSSASLWQAALAASRYCCFSPSSSRAKYYLRIACGVCLLPVAALLLCVAAAAALSVYGGYDFTEGVVGQFMSNSITPLVIYVTWYPLFPNSANSTRLATALGIIFATLAFTVTIPLWRRSAVWQVGRLTSCLHFIRVYFNRCRLALYSLLLPFRTASWSCRGSRRRRVHEGERDTDDSRRDADFATTAAVCESLLSSGTAQRRFGGEDATLHVDTETGDRVNATSVTAAAQTGKNVSDETCDCASVHPAAQRSVRSPLQVVRWWSAPFTRLKEVIKQFLIIVTAKLRGPDAAEALAGTPAAVTPKTAAAGAAGTTDGLESPTTPPGPAAASAAAEGRPAPATEQALLTVGAVGTTDVPATEIAAKGPTEAPKNATAADPAEKRKEEGGNQEKGVASASMFPHVGGVSTDAGDPLIVYRTREKELMPSHFSRPMRDFHADGAASVREESMFSLQKQQGRSVSDTERTKTDADVFLSEEEHKEKSSTFSFVEATHTRGRTGRAAAAGKRGDSESSTGSLLAESEVEEWLMLQETDGKRQ